MSDAAPLPPVCILAGGLGSRLGPLTAATPKPLLDVAGEPFLAYQLRLLARHRAQRVVLAVGYLGQLIEDRIGTSFAGLAIEYSYDRPGEIGTLAAIRTALPLLGDRFLVLYGDTYLEIDYGSVVRDWVQSGAPASMTVLHESLHDDACNAVYVDGWVTRYDKFHPSAEMHWIDYGLGGLTPSALSLDESGSNELASLYSALASSGTLRGYLATNPYREIGTPHALRTTECYLAGNSARSELAGPESRDL